MKKVLALVLALLMALPLFVACQQPTGPAGADTTTGGGNGGDVTPPIGGDVTVLEPIIPEGANYEGTTFKVLSRVGDNPTDWGNYDIVYDPESELVVTEIKNAIKKRNDALYDRLGVDIEQIKGGYEEARSALLNNKHEHDMVIIKVNQAGQLAQLGLLLSTEELPYVDTSKPWYDARALQDLAIKGKNYCFFSDITVVNLDATFLFYFNHNLIEKYQLENPYDLLANGKWTLDAMISMADKATADGDGVPDKGDDWGVAGHQDVIGSLYVGTGEKIAKSDANGKISLTMNNNRIVQFIDKVLDIRQFWARYSISSYTTTSPYGFTSTDNYAELMETYSQGKVLFLGEGLASARDLTNTEVELNVGILPCPKMDENQTEYYTPVNSIAGITCIPNSAPDAERTSVVLEYWAGKSHVTVLPAYYEQAQKSRFSKDEISPDVLDEIFAARTYDLGIAYEWGNLYGRLAGLLYDGKTTFASMYGTYGRAADMALTNFMTQFEKANK